jgi:predicted SAM-dependent methyltransferase
MKGMIKLIMNNLITRSTIADLRDIRNRLQKIYQKIILDTFYSQKTKKMEGKDLLVNFGCGKNIIPNWINIDAACHLPDVYYLDLRDSLPFEDGQVAHIHCEHFLEHLEFDDSLYFLGECYRSLKNNGSIRIIVPDAGKYIFGYCRNDQDFFAKLVNLGGTVKPMKTEMEIINQMFRMGGDHKFAWDYQTLELYLREIGFNRIEKSTYGALEKAHNIDGDDWWRLHESLYVNAYKS